MNLDVILRNRYHIQQSLGSQQIWAIALSLYLAENLELPVTPKPLCVIYCWQITEPSEHGFQHEAIATKLYEIGQKYTLAPKVQAFFNDDDYYCVVREYLEGYAYLEEFNQEFGEKFKQVGNDPNLVNLDHKAQDSDISTIKVPPIAKSLMQSLAKIPIKINRRQLLINLGSSIAGFSFAVFLDRLKPQPKPIVIVETPPVPEPPSDPLKRGDNAFRDDFGNGIYLEMVRVPSGKFMLGAPPNEVGKRDQKSPLVEVRVAAFYIAKFAVTQEQ